MKFNRCVFVLALLLAASLAPGCGDSHQSGGGTAHKHHHEPPHGGTGVTLGDEEFHLEFVLDAATGRIQAYVLSAHMAGFVRLAAESFEVTATVDGRAETLVFKAVTNHATGERPGDTSEFEAQAAWLKTAKIFDAMLKNLTIRGKSYDSVPFSFPKGN
ncbi:MAG: hypothetical protein HZA89_11555 [Verrucomicrobia bacterium]|nr:hypothetical protein [Verrucomicrobiota bacterium]